VIGKTNIWKLYIPENNFDITENYYSFDMLAELLRRHRFQPQIIRFIADMIEDGCDLEEQLNKIKI